MRVTAFLLDEDGRLGRLYGARTTPSAYVVGADGRLLYGGAVDDDPWSEDGPDGPRLPARGAGRRGRAPDRAPPVVATLRLPRRVLTRRA